MKLSRPLAAAALEISDRQSAVSPELNPPESARSAARQSECAGHARRGSSELDLVGCLRSPLIMTHIVIHTEYPGRWETHRGDGNQGWRVAEECSVFSPRHREAPHQVVAAILSYSRLYSSTIVERQLADSWHGMAWHQVPTAVLQPYVRTRSSSLASSILYAAELVGWCTCTAVRYRT
jgi:hypothetical protein